MQDTVAAEGPGVLDAVVEGKSTLDEGATLAIVSPYFERQLNVAHVHLIPVRDDDLVTTSLELDSKTQALAKKALPGQPTLVLRNI